MASEEIAWPVMKKENIYEVSVFMPKIGGKFEIIGTFDRDEGDVYYFTGLIIIKSKQLYPPKVALYRGTETEPFPILKANITKIVPYDDFSMFSSNMIAGKTRRRQQRSRKSKRRHKRKSRRL